MTVVSLDCLLVISDGLTVSQRFPKPSPLGLINLLEQLTELKEIFHLLDLQFIIQSFNSETARYKVWTKGKELACTPQEHHSP